MACSNSTWQPSSSTFTPAGVCGQRSLSSLTPSPSPSLGSEQPLSSTLSPAGVSLHWSTSSLHPVAVGILRQRAALLVDLVARGRVGALVHVVQHAVLVGVLGQRAALLVHLVAGRGVLALVDVVEHAVAVAVLDGAPLRVDLVARRRCSCTRPPGPARRRLSLSRTLDVARPAEQEAQARLDAPVEVVARAVVGRRDVVDVGVDPDRGHLAQARAGCRRCRSRRRRTGRSPACSMRMDVPAARSGSRRARPARALSASLARSGM